MPRWPKIPPLTTEQQKLAADNYPLVLFAVRRLWKVPAISELGDVAIGEGFMALVMAARAFDPGRGVKFSTYALRAIDRNVRSAAIRWRRKTFVPDICLLCRRYRAKVGLDKIEMD